MIACHETTVVNYDGMQNRLNQQLRNDGYGCAAPCNTPGGNLLQNPGFESGLDGWRNYFNGGAPNGHVTYSDGTAHSGASYGAVHVLSSQLGRSFGQDVRARYAAGQTFSAAMWLRAAGGPKQVTLAGRVLGWSRVLGSTTVTLGSAWQLVTTTFTTNAPGDTLRIELYIQSPSPDVLFDDAYLASGGPPTAPVVRPGAPQAVSASVPPVAWIGSGQAKVTWAPPASDGGSPINAYAVQRRWGSSAWVTVATVPGSAKPYLSSGMRNGSRERVPSSGRRGRLSPASAVVAAVPACRCRRRCRS